MYMNSFRSFISLFKQNWLKAHGLIELRSCQAKQGYGTEKKRIEKKNCHLLLQAEVFL